MSSNQLPRKMLISYGLGSAAPTLAHEFCGAFLLLFYTELAGLDPVWVGTALMFRMVLDALIDPLIGRWSDQTRSAAGRRRPWIIAGSVPGLVSLMLLFAVPEGGAMVPYDLSDNGLIINGRLLLSRLDPSYGDGL